MNNPFVALYVCYLAIAGCLLYTAWQGTEMGSVGKPCLDAIIKTADVAVDPQVRLAAEQDQQVKCDREVQYAKAVSALIPIDKR